MAAGGSEELVAGGWQPDVPKKWRPVQMYVGWRLEQTASQRFKLVSFQDQISQFEHSHQVIKYALTYLLMPYFFTMYV
jgi:hypothetical protein